MLEKLEKAYREYISSNRGPSPKIIVVHPETWREVIRDVNLVRYMGISYVNHITHYHSAPVYRSADVEEGKFIMA